MEHVFDAKRLQEPVDKIAARFAAAQHGVFARMQLPTTSAARETIRRRVGAGLWNRVTPDVFRNAGTPPSWIQSVLAECLEWGAGAAASHRCAAVLHELDGFDAAPTELTVPRARRRLHSEAIIHRHPLDPIDRTVVRVIPCTTPARTLIDLAAVAPPKRVEEALDSALRKGLVTIPRLRWRVQELAHPGRPGVVAMRALLEAREHVVPRTVFERRLLREIEAAGLKKPILQHPIKDGGRLVAIVDFAYPEERIALEADGYASHAGRAAWAHDRERSNKIAVLGWLPLRVTWNDLVSRPERIASQIQRALEARAR